MIEIGDCREIMRRWKDEGVQVNTCVTSPPYFGLRDYGHDGQLGLEPTPDQYVANMVDVFRCVRDILRDDGTLWLNLGDSYGTGTTAPRKQGSRGLGAHTQSAQDAVPRCGGMAKQLLGIPWRVALALQADGWYLRQDIIWHKPNPMPESVKDRCTKAHEYIFLLSKNERYYFDNEAIKQDAAASTKGRGPVSFGGEKGRNYKPDKNDPNYRGGNEQWGRTYEYKEGKVNRRSVWTVATKPYPEAHFAVFPPDLIEPCILAGCPHGGIALDPFMGSGTTAAVAEKHGRKYLGCELNPEYLPLQKKRLEQATLI